MPIVGGLDIHPGSRLTFDYLDTETGQKVQRGSRSPPADRGAPAGLAGAVRLLVAARTSGSRSRGAPGGGDHRGTGRGRGRGAVWPSRPTPPFACGRKRHAKTDKTDCRTCADAAGRGPAAARCPGTPHPAASWNAARCWRPYHDLRREHTAWGERDPRRSVFHRGAPRPWARACCAASRAWPRCGRPRPPICPRPGSCRSPPPLDMTRRAGGPAA